MTKATNDTPILRALLGDDIFDSGKSRRMRKPRKSVPKPSNDPRMKVL